MGQKKSKPSDSVRGPKVRLPDIPPDSPLGLIIAHWDDWPPRQGKSREKMIYYCMQVWGGKQIKGDGVFWPVFGSFEDWICQALNIYVNTKEPFSLEESEYASLWIRLDTRVHVFTLSEKNHRKKTKNPEELPAPPPPYVPPTPAPDPTPPPSSPPTAPDPDLGSPSSPEETRRIMRSQTRRKEQLEERLYPLREIAMGGPQPGMGFVPVPLNSGDIREFKKEMGNLLEDPLGVSERLDQFLGPNVYTWEELQAILGILFTVEEREMIQRAGMRVWDQQHQHGPGTDIKWPLQRPNWDNQNAEHRTHMADLRTIIVQGIKKSVPRGQNINKAFSEHQKKDETPTECLKKIRGVRGSICWGPLRKQSP
ncbi:uncharacterized protein LOC121233625 [Aquila chrysaetos chrysaetos]|uniref:uncharacterized protein LOC121233625 n=1 Tax=Aquila chrysaetos chrysaetos TaxID=223781 RepID=UPI001B7D3DE9|nr:uncharacterized protein LOC121233625 [Aquila chrysaetos chrysaetos]